MEELKRILEENAEILQEASSPEELCALLREKGIGFTEEALQDLIEVAKTGPVPLDDAAVENVAGGVPLLPVLNALMMLRNKSALCEGFTEGPVMAEEKADGGIIV